MHHFGAVFTVGELPNKKRKQQLSANERKTHGVRQLFVDRMPVRGDIYRLDELVRHYGIGRDQSNKDKDYTKKFSHSTCFPSL